MNINKAILTTAITGTMFMTSFAPAFAQSVTPTLGARGTAACSRITVRLNDAVARAQNVENRWDNVNTRLQNAGPKVIAYLQAHLPQDVTQYNTLVSTFTSSLPVVKTDAQNYSAALTKVQSDANSGMCGTSNGQFKTDLQATKTARTQLKTDATIAKTNFTAIRTFLQGLKGSVTPTP